MKILEIKKLNVSVAGKQILFDLDLSIEESEFVALMGPNGSGKSSLASVIMGHPSYIINSGEILFQGKNITTMKPEERAGLGIFLSFQNPREIDGLELYPYLFDVHRALSAKKENSSLSVVEFKPQIDEEMKRLNVRDDWSQRYLNVGFSGGEKKKAEMLQLALLDPKFAIFDEIDSGLDVDAMREVSLAIKRFVDKKRSGLMITHYQRILEGLRLDRVFVMHEGRIKASGGPELVAEIEREGFEKIINRDNEKK